jgi:hypothetical protein
MRTLNSQNYCLQKCYDLYHNSTDTTYDITMKNLSKMLQKCYGCTTGLRTIGHWLHNGHEHHNAGLKHIR